MRAWSGWKNVHVIPARGLSSYAMFPFFLTPSSFPHYKTWSNTTCTSHGLRSWPRQHPGKHTAPRRFFQNRTEPLSTLPRNTFSWCDPTFRQQHVSAGNSHKPKLILLHLLLEEGKIHTWGLPSPSFIFHPQWPIEWFYYFPFKSVALVSAGCHVLSRLTDVFCHSISCPDGPAGFSRTCRVNTEEIESSERASGEYKKLFIWESYDSISTMILRENFLFPHVSKEIPNVSTVVCFRQ